MRPVTLPRPTPELPRADPGRPLGAAGIGRVTAMLQHVRRALRRAWSPHPERRSLPRRGTSMSAWDCYQLERLRWPPMF